MGALVGGSDAKFELSKARGRKADWSVYLAGRRPPRHGAVRTPPDMLVEVLSRSPRDERRDRVDKMEEYATFGVRSYGLVDPQRRTLEIHERVGRGTHEQRLKVESGIMADVPGRPGLHLDLDAMWSKIDVLED